MARQQTRATKGTKRSSSRIASAAIGGILIGLAGVWFLWLLLHQINASLPLPPVLPGGLLSSSSPVPQLSPLAAEGITLSSANETPALNQQQALLIAKQLAPDAATNAQHTTARFVLVTYPNAATPPAHSDLHDQPAWLIEYQGVPLASGDSSATGSSTYDLYVFLDGTTGKELLVIRA